MIDITMPAVRRPEILAQTLDSIGSYLLPNLSGFRLIINVDPVGSGTTEDVLDVARQHFDGRVIANTPERGSLNAALRWIWTHAKSHKILYWEDDVEITRPIDFDELCKALDRDFGMAYMQIPWESFETPSDRNTRGVQHEDRGDGVFIRKGQYRMSLQPALMRRTFARHAATLLHDDADPEVQFHKDNPELQAYCDRWRFGSFAKPGDPRALRDIGRQGRPDHAYKKIDFGKGGTSWVPVRDVNCYGAKLRVLDIPPGNTTWQQCQEGKWRSRTFMMFDRFLKPDMVYVDVGAFIGSTLFYAACKAKQVFGFEPDPEAFQVLATNLNLNRETLRAEVTLSDKAVGAKACKRPFYAWHGEWGSSRSTLVEHGEDPTYDVHCVPLDALMKIYRIPRIDYLKLIIQGAEPDVLEQMIPLLQKLRPVLHVTVQPHFYPDRKAGLAKVAKALSVYPHIYRERRSGPVTAADVAADKIPGGEYILLATDEEWK